jgi:MFS family permease
VTVVLLAVLCGLGGLASNIIGFGFSTLRSVRLHGPHQYLGLAALGAAVLYFALSLLLPAGTPRHGRGLLSALRGAWGVVTVAAGVANCVLGIILANSFKGHALVYWVAPAAAAAGAVGFAAVMLEALRIQMRRTQRYDPDTNKMFGVFEASHILSMQDGNSDGHGSGDNLATGCMDNGTPATQKV